MLSILALAVGVPDLIAQLKPVTNAPPAKTAERNIRFQFDGMAYAEVLERFAQMANKPLVADAKPEGTLTYNDPKPYTFGEAMDTLNVILSMKGFILTEDDHYLRVVPLKDLSSVPLKILHGTTNIVDVRAEEIVTVILGLKNLNAQEIAISVTNLLSKAGSVAPLSRGRGLIITDRLNVIRRVETLIKSVDTEAMVDRQMRTHSILHASGAVLADLINRTFGVATAPARTQFNPATKKIEEFKPDPADYVTAVYDDTSRTMVLFGPRDRLEMVDELIGKFENKDGEIAGDVRIYRPQILTPIELADMIRQALPGIAAPGEAAASAATKARLIADTAENRLIVAAPMPQLADEIENLVNKLDRPVHGKQGGGTRAELVQVTRLYRIKNSDPNKVAQILSGALPKRRMANGNPRVTGDTVAGIVVVTASPIDHQSAYEMIRQIESGREPLPPRETKFIEVGGGAEAQRLQPLVQQVYEGQIEGTDPAKNPRAKILVEPESGRLIVTAAAEHLQKIEGIVEQLRSKSAMTQVRELRVVDLKHLRLDTGFENLKAMIDDRMLERPFADVTKPRLVSDAANQRLIVTATTNQLKAIEEIIAVFDVEPARPKREMGVVSIRTKTPAEMIALVTDLLGQSPDADTNPGLAPKLYPDPSGRQIITLATAADLDRIKQLVTRLDVAPAPVAERGFRGVELHSRKAAEMVELVTRLYQEQIAGQPKPEGGTATLLAEDKTNRIMVSGPDKEITRVENIIRQLDPEGQPAMPEETRVVRLRTATAANLSTLIVQSLAEQAHQLKVLVDERSNSLVLTGNTNALDSAMKLVEQLDSRGERIEPREMKVIELNKADATEAAKMVATLAKEMLSDQRGTSYEPLTKVVADTVGRRLILSGPRDELVIFASIIGQIDQSSGGASNSQIFMLRNTQAAEIAKIISNAMTTYDASGRVMLRVTVSADERSNSVIVSGKREDLKDAEAIVKRLDQEAAITGAGPIGREPRELRVVDVNAEDAANLATLATQVFAAQNAGNRVAGQVNFTAEPRGRRIIIMAPRSAVEQAEKVVQLLVGDSAPIARKLESIPVSAGRATAMLETVRSLYTEQSVGGSDKPASLHAGPDGGTIMVYGTPDQIASVKQLVEKIGFTPVPTRATRMVDLGRSSEAKRIAPLAQQLYENQFSKDSSLGPADAQIIADEKSGRIVISGREEHLTAIEGFIDNLKTRTMAAPARETKAIPVGTPADVQRLQPIVQDLYTDTWKDKPENDPADAQIIADERSGRLIVTGKPEHVAAIEKIVQQLGAGDARPVSGRRETRVFELTGNAATVAKNVEQLYLDNAKSRFGSFTPDTLILADAGANRLIAAGDTNELRVIEGIVQQIDSGAVQEGPARVFRLEHADPHRVGEILTSSVVTYDTRGRVDSRVSVAVDAASRTVVATGTPNEMKAAEAIVKNLDTPEMAARQRTPRETKVFDLNAADATILMGTVQSLFTKQREANGGGSYSDALIIPDKAANRIIVSAISNDLASIEKIIKQLDTANAHSEGMRIITLTNAQPEEVASMLSSMLVGYTTRGVPYPRVSAAPAPVGRAIAVTGDKQDLEKAAKIIAEYDRSAAGREERVTRFIPVTGGSADEVASQLKSLYEEQAKSGGQRVDALIMGDATGRRIILTARKSVIDSLEELTKKLQEGWEDSGQRVQLVTLRHVSAGPVAQMVTQLFDQRASPKQAPKIVVTASADDRSILIDAQADLMRRATELVQILDQPRAGGAAVIQSVHLKKADADKVAAAVSDTISKRTDGKLRDVNVTPVSGTKSLLLNGPSEAVQEVMKIVNELDEGSSGGDVEVRIYNLSAVSAREIEPVLSQLLAAAAARSGESGAPKASITIHEQSNALFITASPQQFKLVEKLMPTLDKAPERSDRVVKFVWLQKADAFDVAGKIESVFANRPRGERPLLEADFTGNMITIIARRSDIPQVEDLIQQFDMGGEDTELQVRLLTLSRIPADKMITMLTNIYPQMHTGRIRVVERLQPVGAAGTNQASTNAAAPVATNRVPTTNFVGEVVIALDREANALLISGPGAELDRIDSLARDLEWYSLPGDAELHVFPLTQADPTVVAKTLSELFKHEAAAFSAQAQPAKPGSTPPKRVPPPKMTVVPEPRTRSIIVRASPRDYLLIESLLKQLDQAGEEMKIAYRLIPLKNAPADKLAPMVQLMAKQMKYAQPGDTVVIEAYGRNKSLMVIGRLPVLDNVEKLIRDLDTPATDEEINVEQVNLNHADATTVAQTLTSIFSSASQLRTAADGGKPERGSGTALTKQLYAVPDPRLNAIHLSGNAEALTLAKKIIADMDRELDRFASEVKLLPLRFATASKIVTVLQSVFQGSTPVPGTEGLNTFVTRLQTKTEDGKTLTDPFPRTRTAIVLQPDDELNVLIVAARSDALPLIEEVVKKLDIPEAAGMQSVRVYPLQHIDASNFQRIIKEIHAGNNAIRKSDQPRLTIDDRSNSIIAAGNETSFAIVDSLINLLDKELPLEVRDISLVPLEHADATVLAQTIQQLMDARVARLSGSGRNQTESLRVLIIAEPRSNNLLVTGGQDSFELVQALARKLDGAPPAISGIIRLLPLKYADARTVATTLTSVFTQRYAAASSAEQQKKRPIIVADPRISALLISAAVDDNGTIDDLVAKLDRKLDNPALRITILPLKHNDAGKVAGMMKSFFAARLKSRSPTGQAASPTEQVDIETDSLNNTLIISSNTENLDLIKDILLKIDVEPMVSGGVFELFVLQHADAQRVATLIESLVKQGVYRPGRTGASATAADALAVSVDIRSNTLIVSASPDNLGIVKAVIEKMDTADFVPGSEIKFYQLEHAQASNLAQALTKFFDAKRTGDAAGLNAPARTIPVVIVPDDRLNVLMVTGSRESFEILDRIVPKLDGEDQMSRLNYRVFALKNATANKLQDTLQKLFANRPSTVAGKAPEPITVISDSWINVLLVSAALEDMTMVESLIERLDSEQAELGVAVEVIPVLKANAQRVAETIKTLYQGGTSSGLPIVVNADERMNALVVSGGQTELKRIREVVRKLDTEQVSRVNEIRVIPLKYARAESLAGILTGALNSKPTQLNDLSPKTQSVLQFITRTEDGRDLITSALHEAVQITSDTRMNSLIVSGPVDYMSLLESIIKRLDNSSPRQAKIKVFDLKNSDAANLAKVLTELFQLSATGNQRTIEYTLMRTSEAGEQPVASAVLGAEEQSALRITVDRRTNSLLVGGTEHYVSMVEEIINSLDQNGQAERETEVVRLKNAQAVDIATAVRDFLDQDRERVTQVLGADAVQTAQKLLDREVSVVAEAVSNTLLISANSRFFERIRTIITELDKPSPQVLIQVLLTEVTVDAVRDLGMEWNFTKNVGNNLKLGSQGALGLAAKMANANIGGYSALITGNNFSFILRALENDGRLEILARPQILTADNQPAMVNIGQRVPLITGSQTTPQGGLINTFVYENVGINLSVTPRITGDGFVKIDVATTNSSLSSRTVQINANATVPIINERLATTTVSVQSGKTVVIGGLISTSSESRQKKVPFFGRIPWLGSLFRDNASKDEKKELLIFLTPQILGQDELLMNAANVIDFSKEEVENSGLNEKMKFDDVKKRLLKPLLPDSIPDQPPIKNPL